MKFTKKQAYETIVAKLTPNGETLSLSERSINDQLETLIPLLANEETELDAFVKSCFPIFKTANANVNNDVSKGINKYKEEHPEQKHEEEKKTPEDDNSKLLQRIADLEKAQKERDSREKSAKIRTQFAEKLAEKGVKDKDWVSAISDEINFTEDFDVDAKAESFVKIYNKTMANHGEDFTPDQAGKGKDDYTSSTLAEAAKFIKAQRLEDE